MKLVKSASGKTTIKMSKNEWLDMGKRAGWTGGINKQLVEYLSKLLQSPEDLVKKIEQEKVQQETVTQAGKGKLIGAVLAMFLALPISQVYENPTQAVYQAQEKLNTMALGGYSDSELQPPTNQEQRNQDIYGFDKSVQNNQKLQRGDVK